MKWQIILRHGQRIGVLCCL